MGVRGLTTYINHNQNAILQRHNLHDCNLVIDGNSLCAQLYRSLNCFSAFGGDYDKFSSYIRNFFKNIRRCNITAYILFDGSYEARKLKTAHNRLRSKIHGASKLDPVTQGSLQIFPLLLRDVFKEVLLELKVAFTTCEFEADDEIAAMARYLSCPVLSYDSDFYIYNVLYIPFNTLDFKPTPIEGKNGRFYVLECKIFRVERLLKHFGGLNEGLLPLLATLLGNDYVEKRVFKKFFNQLKFTKSRTKKNDQQRCIHALFKWLQNETLETAIAKILGRLKKAQKNRVFAIIKKSVAGYDNRQCRSLKYFNIIEEPNVPEVNLQMPDAVSEGSESDDESEDEVSLDSDEEDNNVINNDSSEGDNGTENNQRNDLVSTLPDWFREGIRMKFIPNSYINLYTHQLHFCSPQAEDYTDEDAFLCAIPIMRYAYDMLTDFSGKKLIYVSRANDNNYQRLYIGTDYSIKRPLDKPYSELSTEELHSVFYHFLKEKLSLLDIELIMLLPSNFQLFMIALIWWLTHCSVPIAHIYSLFLSYTMLDAIDEKTGTFRGHNFFNNKYSKKVEELKRNGTVSYSIDQELFLNKNKIQYEDCLIAASVLLKHFEIDDSIKKKPKSYDVQKIHSFAQFQCCLQQINCLNTLCREPFECTRYSKCFNGTFIYNITLKLENQMEPKNFLVQYLKGANTVLFFFKSLCQVFEELSKKMNLTTAKWSKKKYRRRRKALDDEITFIIKGFESEVVI